MTSTSEKLRRRTQVAIVFWRGTPPDLESPEQLLEAIGPVDVVVALQHGAPQGLAEPSRPQKDGDLPLLQLRDEAGLVHKEVVVADDLFEVADRVWNALLRPCDISLGITRWASGRSPCARCICTRLSWRAMRV